MNLIQTFKLALKSIISNKMRSFLTMLGMIIGVTSVITLVGLMQGVTNYILSQFADLGTNTIVVSVTNTDTRYVDVDDVYQLVEENKSVFRYVTPSVNIDTTLKFGTKSMKSSVTGVGEDYPKIKRLELADGRFIQYSDVKSRYKGCVIGSYIVKKLFDGNAKVGDTLKINGEVYQVIGIQKEKAGSEPYSEDDCIYIPYTNAVRMSGISQYANYAFDAVNAASVETGKEILENFLYKKMKTEKLYYIQTMAEMIDMVNQTTGVLSSILGGIAGISLIVAGIGIMNIMLVSVVERTREIGIRKSLGAKRRDILWQFVIEAGTISTIGGGIGILLGYFVTTSLGNVFGVKASPTAGSILLAFGVSATIGILFGFMPANKAAKLNPIDALRSE